jgi:hypothetical protein
MKSQVNKTAQFGEFVVAAFDGAAQYSRDPLEVSRLAAGAVSLMLRHTQRESISLWRQQHAPGQQAHVNRHN